MGSPYALWGALPQGWHEILPLPLQAYLYHLSQQHI
jgi:hypothetical protein